MKQPRVYLSHLNDPFVNLALEEWLVRRHDAEQMILLIYRNSPAVVIGRNQNPWLEHSPQACQASGAVLARRVSGGGAVYHDLGNTNFTFLMPRKLYDPDAHLQVIIETLATFGIRATINERHNVLVGRRKVSGTAFMLTGKTALQHGTLLLNADIETLSRCLAPPALPISTNGIRSVSSKVVNLRELVPSITHQTFSQALTRAFTSRWGTPERIIDFDEAATANLQSFKAFAAKYKSREWIFGHTPTFRHTSTNVSLDGNPAAVELRIKNATIESIQFTAVPNPLRQAIEAQLLDTDYSPATVETLLKREFSAFKSHRSE